jgi:hypothetical protein
MLLLLLVILYRQAFLPRTVHVERTVSIARPASTVFALVNGYATIRSGFRLGQAVTHLPYMISGPATGVGARGMGRRPRLSGKGWQEITHSVPYTRVQAELHFYQQGKAATYFSIKEQGGSSTVTWGFDTHLTQGQSFAGGVVAQYFGLLFDRWIGSDYETGLANLKTLAESLPDVDFSGLDVEVLDAAPLDIHIQRTAARIPPTLPAHRRLPGNHHLHTETRWKCLLNP